MSMNAECCVCRSKCFSNEQIIGKWRKEEKRNSDHFFAIIVSINKKKQEIGQLFLLSGYARAITGEYRNVLHIFRRVINNLFSFLFHFALYVLISAQSNGSLEATRKWTANRFIYIANAANFFLFKWFSRDAECDDSDSIPLKPPNFYNIKSGIYFAVDAKRDGSGVFCLQFINRLTNAINSSCTSNEIGIFDEFWKESTWLVASSIEAIAIYLFHIHNAVYYGAGSAW